MSILDDRELRLLEWLLTPDGEREPPTKAALAAELGVHPKTLYAWEKHEHFEAEYNRRWRQLRGGPEKVKAIVDKLWEKAASGDNQAMKLYLEWAKELKKDEPVKDTAPDLRGLSDEDLLRRIEAARNQEAASSEQ